MENLLNGTIVNQGYAIAPAKLIDVVASDSNNSDKFIGLTEEGKLNEFEKAVNEVKNSLDIVANSLTDTEQIDIIGIQKEFLDDPEFVGEIKKLLPKLSPVEAVNEVADNLVTTFSLIEDDYMQARANDIQDISQQLKNVLLGISADVEINSDCVLVAPELMPSDFLKMDKDKIKAVLLENGSPNSHVAILIKTYNIPAIFQIPKLSEAEIKADVPIIVDATENKIIINPSDAQTSEYQKIIADKEAEMKELQKLKGAATVVGSTGKKIHLFANIGSVEEVDIALGGDAEGIGLFRTEFQYLNRSNFPTNSELLEVYKQVVQKMNGLPVIIRTLDVGADKAINYLELNSESNPSLGIRGIRVGLEHPEILKAQIKAILLASKYGNVKIMCPMIASVWEVKEVKNIIATAIEEIVAADSSYTKDTLEQIEFGVNVETPAAVIMSKKIAKYCDFFCVGTNDLTQYTLAADRENVALKRYYDDTNKAVFKMLKILATNALAKGKWCGICGELGSNPKYISKLIKYGFTEFSMNPAKILPLRKIIIRS